MWSKACWLLAIDEAVGIAEQVGQGLSKAHDAGSSIATSSPPT
jgi:hypothetical protein